MDSELNLKDYIELLGKRWRIIACLTIGITLMALIFSLLQKPLYEAKATILIKSGGGSSGLSQFMGFAGLVGANLSSNAGNLVDITEVLQSKAVASKVLKDLKLRDRIKGWDDPSIEDFRLAESVKGMLNKPKLAGNLVELKVRFTDPELTAEIANGFVGALSFYWNELNYTEARKKREYIESQLPRIEKGLKKTEQRLKRFTLLSPQKGLSGSGMMGAVMKSQSQGIEVARISRELDIQNSVYVMLRKEYESVKLEESKEIAPFALVDKADIPRRPVKPRIALNTMVGFMLGLLSGFSVAFFQEYLEKQGIVK